MYITILFVLVIWVLQCFYGGERVCNSIYWGKGDKCFLYSFHEWTGCSSCVVSSCVIVASAVCRYFCVGLGNLDTSVCDLCLFFIMVFLCVGIGNLDAMSVCDQCLFFYNGFVSVLERRIVSVVDGLVTMLG